MTTNIRQCRMCSRLFQSYGSSVCMECTDEMDRGYKIVRDYLYDHPHADILEITKNTGVPEKWILSFLKEERLILQTPSNLLTCEQCGAIIQSGRYCKKCTDELTRLMNTAEMTAMKVKKSEVKSTTAKKVTKMYINFNKN